MNIAYLITRSDAIGGAGIHVRDLAAAVRSRGMDSTVLVGGEGQYLDLLRERGLPYVTLPSLQRGISPHQDFRAYLEIRTALTKVRPHLLSTHSSKAGLLGRMAARSLGIPSIFTAHGWAFTEGLSSVVERGLYAMVERFAARYGSQIVTVSNYDRDLALRNRITAAERIVSIHNGMPDVGPEMRASPEAMPPRLIMVARFEAAKDQETLLRALEPLRDMAWNLDLVGDGPLRGMVEGEVARLGLENRVRFIGYSPDVATLLRGAQIFVLTSHYEGLPRSILEAMRAGLPVVASAVGGVPETVENGVTGYLVPQSDSRALTAILAPLIADSHKRRLLGDAGRQRYEDHFTFDRMLDETLAVYTSIIPTILNKVDA